MLHIHLICLWLHLLFRDNNVFKIIIYFRNRSTLLLSSDTPEECIRALTDGCEPPWGCWELNSGHQGEQSVLSTSEPSLQPPGKMFYTEKHNRNGNRQLSIGICMTISKRTSLHTVLADTILTPSFISVNHFVKFSVL